MIARANWRWGERTWAGIRVLACTYLSALLAGCSAHSQPVEIANAWATATPPNVAVAAAYMDITAHTADRLLRASSPVAQSIEVHQTSIEDGMSKMRPVELALEAGQTVKLEPGGTHLMIIGITAPFVAGQSVPLQLEFERAGTITLDVPVMTHGDDHAHH